MKTGQFLKARFSSVATTASAVMGITFLAWMLVCSQAFSEPWEGAECSQVNNRISRFPVVVDGMFTGPQEWSDVMPQGFVVGTNGNLFRTCPSDASDTFVYAVIATGTTEEGMELYLMYDFLRLQPVDFQDGTRVVKVMFDITVNRPQGPMHTPATVHFVSRHGGPGTGPTQTGPCPNNSFFDVFVEADFDGDGKAEIVAGNQVGIEGALTFGTSPNSNQCHAMAELEVPLRISPAFADPNHNGQQDPGEGFPPNGVNPATGLYDPDPKFWGSVFKNNPNDPDPPGSANILTINVDGSVSADSSFVPIACNTCLQDEKKRILFRFNPTNGNYVAMDCDTGLFLSGTGIVTGKDKKQCKLMLDDKQKGRNVHAEVDVCKHMGNANIEVKSPKVHFEIHDKNTLDDTFTCH